MTYILDILVDRQTYTQTYSYRNYYHAALALYLNAVLLWLVVDVL